MVTNPVQINSPYELRTSSGWLLTSQDVKKRARPETNARAAILKLKFFI
jgi:hypothetical protein